MKKLYLVIGIVVILALVCSPVLAMSKSDLIASYKGSTTPTITTQIVTPKIPSWMPEELRIFSDGVLIVNPDPDAIPKPAPVKVFSFFSYEAAKSKYLLEQK
jgi:hypothetical protein